MHVYESLPELIGNTPLLELQRLGKLWNAGAPIYAKLEYFNPLGSIKDRAALYMIDEAQKAGKIKDGTVVIEPHLRQHRHRPRLYLCHRGVKAGADHAGKHEQRTQKPSRRTGR